MKAFAILTDVTKCIGCEECVAACKKTNHTGEDRPWRWQRRIDDLSATRWTTVIRKPERHFVRQQCRHCLSPACVSVCPVGALQKTPEGAVIYDSNICMGCRYCMMSCPFGIPRYLWAAPVPYVRKCILCYQKIKSGELKQPACTAACPTGATIFGEREDLLAIAHVRIRSNPGKYIDHVYGENEVGGTSVLYVSDIPLDFLGLQKDLGQEPMPQYTWGALKEVPWVFSGMGLAMLGTYWIIERRQRLMGTGDDSNEGRTQGKPEDEKDKGELK